MLLRLQISYACHGRMITRLYSYCLAIPAIVLGKTPLEILDLSVPLLLNNKESSSYAPIFFDFANK
jgi:hypothetical protein